MILGKLVYPVVFPGLRKSIARRLKLIENKRRFHTNMVSLQLKLLNQLTMHVLHKSEPNFDVQLANLFDIGITGPETITWNWKVNKKQ